MPSSDASNAPDEPRVVGRWRILEMEVWAGDMLDLVEPARIHFEADGMGSLVFIAIRAGFQQPHNPVLNALSE